MVFLSVAEKKELLLQVKKNDTALRGERCGLEQEGGLRGNVLLSCLVYLLGSNFCLSQENLNLRTLAGLKRASS